MSGSHVSQSLYDTLPDPEHHIRLLEIHSSPAGDGIIRCGLSTWRIDVAPPYHAISYTWGDPDSIAVVEVNGRDTRVQQNCHFVLHQVGQNNHSRYYWIDSLCINQDDIQEKGFQVAMMGNIYRLADQVLVCVGRHEEDSEFFFNILNQQKDLFARVSRALPLSGRETSDEVPDKHLRRDLIKWKLSQKYSSAERLVKAYCLFEQRPYFGRVWTLQEVFLAKSTTVCCGDCHCPGEAILGFGISIRFGNASEVRLVGRIYDRFRNWLVYERPLVRRIIPWSLHNWWVLRSKFGLISLVTLVIRKQVCWATSVLWEANAS